MAQLTRIKRIKQDKFTAVSNAVLKDRDLSLKAKGLLVLVMSLQDDWDFTVKGLVSIVKEGRDSVYAGIRELIQAGYCRAEQPSKAAGKFGEVVYVFTEQKWVFEPHTGFPYPEEPHTEEPHTENPTQYKTKEIKDGINKRLKEGAAEKTAAHPTGYNVDDPCFEKFRPGAPNLQNPIPSIDPLLLLEGTFPVARPAAKVRALVARVVLDTRLWTRVLADWKASGHNPRNIEGMVDRYIREARKVGERDDRGLIINRVDRLETVH